MNPTIRRSLIAAAIPVVLLAMPRTATTASFTLAGVADTIAVARGETFTLDLVLRDTSPPFNAFDLDVRFDPGRLTNVPISPLSAQRGPLMTSACLTNSPFHLFTPSPDSLVCTMVILCNGVSVTGPGTLYRVRFTAAATDAWTTLSFGNGTMFYMGGPEVDTLVRRPIVIRIGTPPVLDAGGRRAPLEPELDPVVPNPGRSARDLAVSFRLPREDRAEVMLLDPQGRRIAACSGRFAAGVHRLPLSLPRLGPGRYVIVLRTASGTTRTRAWVVLR